ncbi:MAG: uracil-DNA glycosylase [Candidatus Methanomethylicaceae archaeon]
MRQENCTRCWLGETCRTACIWGEGPTPCKVMLVGEAPGAVEDLEGRPFIGEAGKLLDHILGKLQVDRSSLYITNCIKCRPPDNELPSGEKLMQAWTACQYFFNQELLNVRPKVIVVMGDTAARLVGKSKRPINQVERLWLSRKIIAAYHPAFILRNPQYEYTLAEALFLALRKAQVSVKGSRKIIKDYKLFPYRMSPQ